MHHILYETPFFCLYEYVPSRLGLSRQPTHRLASVSTKNVLRLTPLPERHRIVVPDESQAPDPNIPHWILAIGLWLVAYGIGGQLPWLILISSFGRDSALEFISVKDSILQSFSSLSALLQGTNAAVRYRPHARLFFPRTNFPVPSFFLRTSLTYILFIYFCKNEEWCI